MEEDKPFRGTVLRCSYLDPITHDHNCDKDPTRNGLCDKHAREHVRHLKAELGRLQERMAMVISDLNKFRRK